jgi:beta-aspartyl-peptidase (threonine type)
MFKGILLGVLITVVAQASPCPAGKDFLLLAHGGAGDSIKPSHQAWYREKFTTALNAGYKVLQSGGRALDAVQATLTVLEDSGAFDAGKGAVRTSTGGVELDASLMDGRDLRAGAVAAVTTIKNPILAAHRVMQKTWHVLMVGPGADSFAASQGLEKVSPSYFKQIKPGPELPSRKGTVGAVALDCHGDLAAATSTGGLEGKLPGRVGDSPIIGAGTYADNRSVAVSGTGDGEYFIRAGVARDIAAQIDYLGASVEDAAKSSLAKVKALGGTGGVIVIDRQGHFTAPHNTPGMLHGYVHADGKMVVEFH